ncbi:MAG: type II 3-dehydroquinate dehydratase [Desulfobacter postgatei]|uniref:3-dehydroquinate dehydratase n=1 Tax=Desulfobacter postgatei TaxID=2293 RepID=A0A2G6MQP8_9BACT|nr:MAG: type II 3-dehydroquinate dehydratase [Desulfobacter postgatei]
MIHVINGPNLNMLGKREPEIYGAFTLDQINGELKARAHGLGLCLHFFQSNHQGRILDYIHAVFEQGPAGVIINPGALTHTSVALRDALAMLSCPIVEVHLSNIHKREPFRHTSMIADIATGQLTGFGHYGYYMALDFLHALAG